MKFGGGEQVSLSPTWILYHPTAAWPSYILQIMCVLSETVESILLCPCVHACAHVLRLMTLHMHASRICMAECMPSSFMKSTVICDKEVFLSQMHSHAWWSMSFFYLWRLTRPYMDNLGNLNSFFTLTEWCFLVFMKTEDCWITKLVLFLTYLNLISS